MHNPESQSLIHQVSDSDGTIVQDVHFFYAESQSLIHQVSDSDFMPIVWWLFKIHCVSIPYSSGLRFRLYIKNSPGPLKKKGLNPLFIRSQIQILSKESDWMEDDITVSIPYSSGLRFRFKELNSMRRAKSGSQSLIHQVSDSDKNKFQGRHFLSWVSIPYSSGLRFRWSPKSR